MEEVPVDQRTDFRCSKISFLAEVFGQLITSLSVKNDNAEYDQRVRLASPHGVWDAYLNFGRLCASWKRLILQNQKA